MPAYRFILLTACLLLGACAGYSACVLSSATWAEARAIDHIFPFYGWHIRPFTAATLSSARHGLALIALALAAAGTGLLLPARGRYECTLLGQETRRAWAGLRAGLTALTARQRRWAWGLLATLTIIRLYLSLYNPAYDDVASYEVFVSKGWLATSAYYPIPNNHVFSNTISLLFYQLNPNFWWTMRLPVLLICTVATIFLFTGLLRCASFGVAAGAITLFSCLQLSLYHAGVGRGYWLLLLLAGIVFFCTLALQGTPRQPRAAWLGLVVAGVLGTYTVPTFILVLASAFSWLGLGLLRQKKARALAILGITGTVVAAGALLLYAPLLFLSGLAIFFGNGFVAPHPWAEFWAGLPTYLWQTEGFLAGQMKVGTLITLGGLAASVTLLKQAHRLPETLRKPWTQLAPAALWFMLFPYTVLIARRIFAPERALFYKAFFFFVLLTLVLEWLVRTRRQRGLRPALGIAALLWLSYQVNGLRRDNQLPQRRNDALHEAFLWLELQPRGAMLIPEPTQSLFMRMYLHSERPGQAWHIDTYPRKNIRYTYVLAFPNHRGLFQPRFSYPPTFHNEQADIYRVESAAGQNAGIEQSPPPYWYLAQ